MFIRAVLNALIIVVSVFGPLAILFLEKYATAVWIILFLIVELLYVYKGFLVTRRVLPDDKGNVVYF